MGVAIPQIITEDRASSAEIFESSYFHNGDSRFIRNYASAGNRKTWSHSTWIKRTEVRDAMVIGLSVTAGGYGEESTAEFNGSGSLSCFGSSNGSSWTTFLQTRNTFLIVIVGIIFFLFLIPKNNLKKIGGDFISME